MKVTICHLEVVKDYSWTDIQPVHVSLFPSSVNLLDYSKAYVAVFWKATQENYDHVNNNMKFSYDIQMVLWDSLIFISYLPYNDNMVIIA